MTIIGRAFLHFNPLFDIGIVSSCGSHYGVFLATATTNPNLNKVIVFVWLNSFYASLHLALRCFGIFDPMTCKLTEKKSLKKEVRNNMF